MRFDILSKWFEKFSFKSISDQRNNLTVFADGKTLGNQDEFYFLDSGKHFEYDYSNFKERIINISSAFFSKYKTVDNYYINDVLPVLNKERSMSDVGADWIFEYLAAVKLCQFERYDEMVAILKEQIQFMNNRNEPNVSSYKDMFEIVFKELKTVKLGK
ncbi:hypothetical protein [Rufibacter sp. XAAS-G3-1]|uniref:hypothetical protein n=1 Tax=Rufibacter sp. XAAS-G3-1 TaxID=2729134 RepID=UPI0015E63CDE|nr:hypothetical protein [Rufibacter sp. XAAS-G3-1]